jgi:phage/plasmid-associated DNA primase
LTTEEELSGIFNILMKGLRTIRRTKNLYVNEKTIEEKRIKYERAINPIRAFLNEAISEESTEASYVPKTHLYGVYIQYCNEFSLPVEKYLNFSKILENEFSFQDTRLKPDKSIEIEEVENRNGNNKKKDDRIAVWRHTALIEKYARKSDQTTFL